MAANCGWKPASTRADGLGSPEVNAPQDDMRFTARFHIGLDGQLSVQFHGYVHHASSLHQAVGRCICPSAGQVDTHGTPCPHNLVVVDREAGSLSVELRPAQHPLPQEGEGPVGSLLLTVSAFEPQQFGAEHGIVHSGEHRLTVGQRVGLCDIGGSEFTGRFFQVNLVEHAVPVVACQERPYLLVLCLYLEYLCKSF